MLAGQAQKEFTLNEALSLVDALYPQSVVGSQPAPPATPAEGACYRITAPATGAWADHADHVAVLIGGAWHFVAPVQGMAIFDRAADHLLVFRSGWKSAQAPGLPSGGGVTDAEARAAIVALVDALRAVGILATATP